MKKRDLLGIINDIDKSDMETDVEKIMYAYHVLDSMDEPHLGQMIDDYVLDKLEPRPKRIFEKHLSNCKRCRDELKMMGVLLEVVKELGNEIL